MNEVNDGGPAFPVPSEDSGPGMTLRDWFAGQALARLASRVKDELKDGKHNDYYGVTDENEDEVRRKLLMVDCREAAEFAYMLADAFLQARKEPDSENE